MEITSRRADRGDLPELVRLYRLLEAEQAGLKPMWPLADGLAEPVDDAFLAILEDDDSVLSVGQLDDVPVGFIWARCESLLPQAEAQRVAAIRLIVTQFEARGVGVGATMIEGVLTELRSRGIALFDAYVSPGHRHAKNFFEANGFAARLIVMHHADEKDPGDPRDGA